MQLPTPPLSDHIPHALLRKVSHKPSAPIEIPRSRKHSTRYIRSPSLRTTSPDMIFDMSPVNVSSNSPFSSHVPLGSNKHHDILPLHGRGHGPSWRSTSPRPSTSPHEPFMYYFPMLPPPPSQSNEKMNRYLEPPKSPVLTQCQGNVSSIGRSHSRAHSYLTSACLKNEDEDEFRSFLHTQSPSPSSFATPDLKLPIRPLPYPKQKPNRSVPSPGPLVPFPSRMFRPAGCDEFDENLSPVGTDSSPLDFEKYLIHRMEDEKAVRVRRSKTISSMRVRFGDDLNRALKF